MFQIILMHFIRYSDTESLTYQKSSSWPYYFSWTSYSIAHSTPYLLHLIIYRHQKTMLTIDRASFDIKNNLRVAVAAADYPEIIEEGQSYINPLVCSHLWSMLSEGDQNEICKSVTTHTAGAKLTYSLQLDSTRFSQLSQFFFNNDDIYIRDSRSFLYRQGHCRMKRASRRKSCSLNYCLFTL